MSRKKKAKNKSEDSSDNFSTASRFGSNHSTSDESRNGSTLGNIDAPIPQIMSQSHVISVIESALNYLTVKQSKSAHNSRLLILKNLLQAFQSQFYLADYIQSNSNFDTQLDSISNALYKNAKVNNNSTNERILSLQCCAALSVQISDMEKVSFWLEGGESGLSSSENSDSVSYTNYSWQELISQLIQIKNSISQSFELIIAAMRCLVCMHLVSDFENDQKLTEIMSSITEYWCSTKQNCLKASLNSSEHQQLMQTSFEAWSILFTFLSTEKSVEIGFDQIKKCVEMLVSEEVPVSVKISIGDCLALVCERFKGMHSKLEHTLLSLSQTKQLPIILKTLINCSDKSMSREARKQVRSRFRIIQDSLQRDIGSWITGWNCDGTKQIVFDKEDDSLNEPHPVFNRNRQTTLTNNSLDSVSLILDKDSNSDDNEAEVFDDYPNFELGGSLNLGQIKLPKTNETVNINCWSRKRYYECLSASLGGGLQTHLQYNSLVREIFGLGPCRIQPPSLPGYSANQSSCETDDFDYGSEKSASKQAPANRNLKLIRSLNNERNKKFNTQMRDRQRKNRENFLDSNSLDY